MYNIDLAIQSNNEYLDLIRSQITSDDPEINTFFLEEEQRINRIINNLKRLKQIQRDIEEENLLRVHTVTEGESFFDIINETYGNITIWEQVFIDNALNDITLEPGQQLILKNY